MIKVYKSGSSIVVEDEAISKILLIGTLPATVCIKAGTEVIGIQLNNSSPGEWLYTDFSTIGGEVAAITANGVCSQISELFSSVQSTNGQIASDGSVINPENLDQLLVYNVDGTLNYIQVVSGGSTYRQTFGYTDGNVTSISKWTLQ